MGVILDFRDNAAYVVFKELIDTPAELFWTYPAYKIMLINNWFRARHFTGEYTHHASNALFLIDQTCSLPTLLDTVINQPPKNFPVPFTHIIPIVLRESHPDGIPLLRQLLQLGLKTLYSYEQSYIRHYAPSLECRYNNCTKLYYDKKEYYVGTIIDLCQILTYLERGANDFWICYEDQVTLYGRYIPLDHIISIPRRHD